MLGALAIVAAILLFALVLRARRLQALPELAVWHRARLRSEITARDATPTLTLDGCLALEARLFDELERVVVDRVPAAERQAFNRFHRGSLSDPRRLGEDGNRSFVRTPEEPRGGALLLHGLTDSPYTLRALGDLLADRGLFILGLRLPGHGTAPGGLAGVSRHDWRALTRRAAEWVGERTGGGPLFLVGYSTGGTLALHLALDALEEGPSGPPAAQRIFLLSPAIGVTFFARLANWHKAISFLPPFEKAKWLTLAPEYDPFKYNSLHKNGADQVHLLAKRLRRRLALAGAEQLAGLPPITTFQSAVDATVVLGDLLDDLYARLHSDSHELVLFDTNRWSAFRDFLRGGHDWAVARLATAPALPFRFTLVTNRDADSRRMVARVRPAGGAFEPPVDLGLDWPDQVYSLSHVALPFPPHDAVYGTEEGGNPEGDFYHLGSAHPRGERDLLRVPVGQLMRLRHNPFWAYLAQRIGETVDREVAAASM